MGRIPGLMMWENFPSPASTATGSDQPQLYSKLMYLRTQGFKYLQVCLNECVDGGISSSLHVQLANLVTDDR